MRSKTIISAGGFVTSGPAAARAIVKHLLAAPAQGGVAPRHPAAPQPPCAKSFVEHITLQDVRPPFQARSP
jgi:hypothetical protein